MLFFLYFIVTEFLHIVKQATAILVKHVVDMHKREIIWLTFDCLMPRLLICMVHDS